MNTVETERPRPVLTHRRGLVPNHQGRNRIVSQPTATTLIGNPDDDFNGIVSALGPVKRPGCPEWCIGHHPSDDDVTFCIPAFYDWVDFDNGRGDGDNVVVSVAQYVGEQPEVCVFPGDSPERGVMLPDDKTDKLISLLIAARRVIDPTYDPSAVLSLLDPSTPKAA